MRILLVTKIIKQRTCDIRIQLFLEIKVLPSCTNFSTVLLGFQITTVVNRLRTVLNPLYAHSIY